TSAYRHVIFREQGVIRGKIHVPQMMTAWARGDRRGIPVLRATRQLNTIENLFISEALRLSIAVVETWKARGGAEGLRARKILSRLTPIESMFPWNELRHRPRPGFQELIELVLFRQNFGAIAASSHMVRLARLFDGRRVAPEAFEVAGDDIALLVTQEPEFEDKLFEILCLAWTVEALAGACPGGKADPKALKGAHGLPVFSGLHPSGWSVDIFFQRGAGLLPSGRWLDTRNGKPLRGIPDIILRMRKASGERLVILDAKNRSTASESEVAYKLLGYKENFGLGDYFAVGLYPGFHKPGRMRSLSKGGEHIKLIHVPLWNGRRLIRGMLHAAMRRSATH
ncbi:MAG TPA: hypothetical protein VG798_03930, partial [Rhizomicrobium sp.]|nr:hypothetical protein [Rhizomicrobium sp.]